MKSLKIAALATIAIFLSACDNASQTTPTGDSAEAVGSVGSAQTLLEAPEPPREIKVCNSAQELADAYLEAMNNEDRQMMSDITCWKGVEDRKRVERRLCMMLGKRTLSDVVVTPIKKSFQEMSMKGHEVRGVRFVPNLLVGAVLTPKSEKGDGQVDIGQHEGRWYLVAYIPQ